MQIDVRGLAQLTQEASELANRTKLTSQEEKRYSLLLSQISLLKTGQVTLAELQNEENNQIARKYGLPQTRAAEKTTEERARAEAFLSWVKAVRENRDETEGAPMLSHIGTYSGLGTFVPTQFVKDVYFAMAAHDAFLDPADVTVLNDTNGRPKTVPTVGDIEVTASVIAESADGSGSAHDISAPGHAKLGAYSYRSPLWRLSIEAMQDVESMGGAIELFKAFAADRIARGVARDLVSGNGTGVTLGIIPSLVAAGVTGVTAVGSSGNTGGSESGVVSVGSVDIAAVYFAVNEAYRNSPRAAFFMNDSTRTYLAQIVTKQGLPLVNWQGSEAFIYGKPVKIAPSMDNIGAGKVPVLFGDGQFWCTRKIVDDLTYVQLVKEAPGLIENGECALRMFVRADGALAYTDSGSPAPFSFIRNHT